MKALVSFTLIFSFVACVTVTKAQNSSGQTEYSTYAPPGNVEMVDLATGNFRMNMPVLEIPGPEGSFSLPLHYRAGIGLNQEASWVGLGWSMNPGAITRSINQFPDDACGEPSVMINKNPGRRGWYSNIGSVNMGWDSQAGHVGNVDIGFATVGWKNGLNSGSLAGIGYQDGKGATFDAMRFSQAVMLVATAGASSPMGVSKLAAIGAKATVSAGMGMGSKMVANYLREGAASKAGGYNRVSERYSKHKYHTDYWMFIDQSSTQKMYGSLYFQEMGSGANPYATERNYGPLIQRGLNGPSEKAPVFYTEDRPSNSSTSYRMEVAGDVSLTGQGQYITASMEPVSIAHDAFTVMAPGISGSIQPYRLDVGSVAGPRQMSADHYKYNTVPYAQSKVGFIYEGSPSNSYEYPQGTGTYKDQMAIETNWQQGKLTLRDPLLFEAAARVEPNREGLVDGRLAHGQHIEWFTNEEIGRSFPNSPMDQGKLLEFKKPESYTVNQPLLIGYTNPCNGDEVCDQEPIPHYQDNWVAVRNAFRANLPAKGIGGFVITAEDGTRYHFTLPVYDYNQFTKSWDQTDPRIYTTYKQGLTNANYKYATTWLLTAITGSDYVDLGEKGVLDAADQGRWVKFEYGRFSSQFKWHAPYSGTLYSRYSNFVNPYLSYSEGYKETYYLNAISTRSHTALFIKDVRADGRGHYTGSPTRNPDLNILEQYPASSLKLTEVALLTNQDYEQLQNKYGVGLLNTANNATTRDGALGPFDSFAQVVDVGDIEGIAAVRSFLNEHSIKRIVFNYSNDLCGATLNSFESARDAPRMNVSADRVKLRGKLTLEGIQTYGPQNTKLIPDFTFGYGYNPAYDEHKWDGFGFYLRSGTRDGARLPSDGTYPVNSTGQTSADEDGSAWSLTKVRNPLGSTLEIQYERDQYAAVSQYGNSVVTYVDQGTTAPNGTFKTIDHQTGQPTSLDLRTLYKPRDTIHLQGFLANNYEVRTTDEGGTMTFQITERKPYEADHIISSVTQQTVTIANPPANPGDFWNWDPSDTRYEQVTYQGYAGFTFDKRLPKNRNGGDIRVARLITYEEASKRYQTRYLYTNGLSTGYNSTGVISREPQNARYPISITIDQLDYPTTPVLYGKVTELTGPLQNAAGQNDDTAFHVRTEYEFTTPTTEMVTVDKGNDGVVPPIQSYPYYTQHPIGFATQRNNVLLNTALIGQPKSVRAFNRQGDAEQETIYNYTNSITNDANITHQGYFSEGVLLSEITKDDYSESRWYSLNRTTKTTVPTYLAGTTTTANGVRTQSQTDVHSFLTAAPLESSVTNSLGIRYKSVQLPAYKIYPGMGPLVAGIGNKNMLTQTVATTASKVADGSNSAAVIDASATTWKNDWATYRTYNSTQDQYTASTAEPVWRQHASYAWYSPDLNSDGSFTNFVGFNWNQLPAANQRSGWLKVGEATRYDHYSQTLDAQDVNGAFSAQKMGYNDRLPIASIANARSTEMAYSGAEDPLPMGSNQFHFGGEVRDGGRQNATYHHTGLYSSRLEPDQKGFTYRAIVGDAHDISVNRQYRLSAWVHKIDAVAKAGKLYASIAGTTVGEASIASPNTKKAGDWYLLNLIINVPGSATGQELVVGCQNTGAGIVFFDDFRFHPVEGPMTAFVYDPHTWQTTYVLDNDNLYTRYQYDAAGKLYRVYKETLDRPNDTSPTEKLAKEYLYNYGHQTAYANQEVSVTLTRNDCPFGTGGQVVYTVPAGRHTSTVSQADADAQAQADTATNAQSYANTNGTCSDCPPEGTVLCSFVRSENDNHASEWMCKSYHQVADGNCGYRIEYVSASLGQCPGGDTSCPEPERASTRKSILPSAKKGKFVSRSGKASAARSGAETY